MRQSPTILILRSRKYMKNGNNDKNLRAILSTCMTTMAILCGVRLRITMCLVLANIDIIRTRMERTRNFRISEEPKSVSLSTGLQNWKTFMTGTHPQENRQVSTGWLHAVCFLKISAHLVKLWWWTITKRRYWLVKIKPKLLAQNMAATCLNSNWIVIVATNKGCMTFRLKKLQKSWTHSFTI